MGFLNRFGKNGRNFYPVGYLSLNPIEPRLAAEHAVQFIHHDIDRFVEIVTFRCNVHTRTPHFYVTLCDILIFAGDVLVVLETHPESNDLVFVMKKLPGLFLHDIFQRLRQIEVTTSDYYLITVHTCFLGLGLNSEADRTWGR